MATVIEERDAYLAETCKEQKASLWGQECTIHPVAVTEKIGDGLQVLYWGTIDQRPQYWVICIDSKTDIEADGFNEQDELINMVEDEYGSYEPSDEDDYDDFNYPIVKNTMGTFWGVLRNFGINPTPSHP